MMGLHQDHAGVARAFRGAVAKALASIPRRPDQALELVICFSPDVQAEMIPEFSIIQPRDPKAEMLMLKARLSKQLITAPGAPWRPSAAFNMRELIEELHQA